jgi:hypothetical protein
MVVETTDYVLVGSRNLFSLTQRGIVASCMPCRPLVESGALYTISLGFFNDRHS